MVRENHDPTSDMIIPTDDFHCPYSWPPLSLQGDNTLAMQILQHEWHKVKEVDRSKASTPDFQALGS